MAGTLSVRSDLASKRLIFFHRKYLRSSHLKRHSLTHTNTRSFVSSPSHDELPIRLLMHRFLLSRLVMWKVADAHSIQMLTCKSIWNDMRNQSPLHALMKDALSDSQNTINSNAICILSCLTYLLLQHEH